MEDRKWKMKKILLVFIIAFALGFLTHALVFPDFLANGIVDIESIAIPLPTPTGKTSNVQAFETYITYDGEHFSRHNIAIQIGSYLIITNTSKDKLMWLISNDPHLATIRGYGEAEQIRERMDTRGQFIVADKNNPKERLVITVK